MSPAEVRGLKKKLRPIGLCSEAVLREVALIQKLRHFLPRD
jgi:hypothetical protein